MTPIKKIFFMIVCNFIVIVLIKKSPKHSCHSEERSDEESREHPRLCTRDPSLRSG